MITGSALSDAAALVEAHRTIQLADEHYQAFLAGLDAPMRAPTALVELARRAGHLERAD